MSSSEHVAADELRRAHDATEPSVPDGEVAIAMVDLHNAVNRLIDSVDKLVPRLGDVLSPPSDDGKVPGELSAVHTTPLAGHISEQTERIRNMTRVLVDVRERVQL